MGQLKTIFNSLSLAQKISIGVAAVLVLSILYAFSNWRREQDFKPLYTGIAPEEAAAMVQKIKESGSDYRLSENGSIISVPSAKVSELRLEMAAAGLPKSGRIGFELFDKTNFGATDFVEHINYNRALEGELERTIDSLSAIEHSRVHITAPKDSVFTESREPGKASVTVSLRAGATLFPQNVVAVQQLISSAVEGVASNDVSVVDTRGTLLSRRKSALDADSDALYSYRERMEHELVDKINGTLEPLLGRDRFRAGVSVDFDLTSSEQSEETYDPTKSVMVNAQKSEEVTAGGATAGIPGTASNLPRPPARVGGPNTATSRRTENITYESSHVVRKTKIPEGQLRRMSISVLLDQKAQWQGKGAAKKLVPIPPSAETLKAVHDLVVGITGFSTDRGDQITVESLPFESTLAQEAPPDPATPTPAAKKLPLNWKDYLHNRTFLIEAGAGLLILLLGGGALFMFLRKRKAARAEATPALKGGSPLTLEQAKAKGVLESANTAEQIEGASAERALQQQRADLATLASLKLPAISTTKTELLSKEIRETTKKDPSVSAHVLQTWLHDE